MVLTSFWGGFKDDSEEFLGQNLSMVLANFWAGFQDGSC
jgi:truncated hemoglobin YjbI